MDLERFQEYTERHKRMEKVLASSGFSVEFIPYTRDGDEQVYQNYLGAIHRFVNVDTGVIFLDLIVDESGSIEVLKGVSSDIELELFFLPTHENFEPIARIYGGKEPVDFHTFKDAADYTPTGSLVCAVAKFEDGDLRTAMEYVIYRLQLDSFLRSFSAAPDYVDPKKPSLN